MKITPEQLKKIIKEEIDRVLGEQTVEAFSARRDGLATPSKIDRGLDEKISIKTAT
jgi:hypothetical protein